MQYKILLFAGLAAVIFANPINQLEERQATIVIVPTTASPVAVVTAVVKSTVTDVVVSVANTGTDVFVSVANTGTDTPAISVTTIVATYYTASLVPVFTPQTSAIAVTSLQTFVALPSLTTSIGSVAVATNIIYSPITSVFATNSFRFNTPTSIPATDTTSVGAGAATSIVNTGAATTTITGAATTTALNAATGTTAVNIAAATTTVAAGGASAAGIAIVPVLPRIAAAAVAVAGAIFALLCVPLHTNHLHYQLTPPQVMEYHEIPHRTKLCLTSRMLQVLNTMHEHSTKVVPVWSQWSGDVFIEYLSVFGFAVQSALGIKDITLNNPRSFTYSFSVGTILVLESTIRDYFCITCSYDY